MGVALKPNVLNADKKLIELFLFGKSLIDWTDEHIADFSGSGASKFTSAKRLFGTLVVRPTSYFLKKYSVQTNLVDFRVLKKNSFQFLVLNFQICLSSFRNRTGTRHLKIWRRWMFESAKPNWTKAMTTWRFLKKFENAVRFTWRYEHLIYNRRG